MDQFSRNRQPRADNTIILGTGFVLLVAFIALVLLFFIFSSFTPALMGKCVAVINVDMPLSVQGEPPSLFGMGSPGSEEMAAIIEETGKRDDVGAVLFVFNSPGGSVVATREVYEAVKDIEKPKVSYFREMAASGAYYIATGTDYIVSDPDALTGSIGVIATVADMTGLLEKIGVNVTAIKSGPYKDIGSSYRNMTDEESVILQNLIKEVYDEFRQIVLDNRKGKLNMARFAEATDGRVLSGRQALALGLVDQVGNKKDAIMKAAELAGFEAENPEDVRLCPVITTTAETGLFSVEGLLRSFQMRSGSTTMNYR